MLPSLSVAFLSGLVLGSFVPYFPLSVSCLLVVSPIILSLWERRFRDSTAKTTLLCGCVLFGVLYWSVTVERPARDGEAILESDSPEEVTGRIIAPVQQTAERMTAIVLRDASAEGKHLYRLRLTWRVPDRSLFQGDRIRFRARIRRPSGSLNPGGFDYVAYLERQGISATASVNGEHAVERLEGGANGLWWAVWNQLDKWRDQIRLAAVQSLSQPALGIYLGIVIGERNYIDSDLREQFMVTGTVHLLSISGSHLGLVALLTFAAVRGILLRLPAGWLLRLSRTAPPTRMAALVTVIPVTLYACLAGAELATMRSLLMVLVALLARWLGYEQRMLHALALAAILILLHDPQALYDISFQLSFLSVLAIAGWLSRSEESDSVLPEHSNAVRTTLCWARDAMVMSGVVTAVTLPLVALYFNQIPWLGLFTNVVAVPVMGLFLVPIGLLSALWQLADGSASLPLSSAIQVLIDGFIAGMRMMSAFPIAEWHVASPSIPLMALFFALLMGAWRRRSAWTRWAAVIGLVCILFWWVWSPHLSDGHNFRVTFLDVGQGDSAVLEFPNGEVVLIDGGATYERFDMGRSVVAPYLWNRGIRSIDHVIATHPQLDHVGGLAWVMRHFPVREYWGTGEVREEAFYDRLRQSVSSQGLSEQVAYEGMDIVSSGECRLQVLNPPEYFDISSTLLSKRQEGHGLNNRSVVTLMTCGLHQVLFTADIEREAINRIKAAPIRRSIEILKVPHHGAVSSLDRDWIASLHPRVAIISAGKHNPYNHPAAAVIQAYVDEHVSLYRTDRDGGIWITGNGSEEVLTVHRTRDRKLQPIDLSSCGWPCECDNWYRVWTRWKDRT
ncbi:putative Competence protein ComEC/Rec2 related protein [Nitrospira sp. KM1]|uniref:DNA internalization-related competence protein ComEC/Rec2 n=1 Tax=Nitrospira sp. KM1 TaxID=1936990 RepID=UPI0013A713EB|nr:DNA internalization-related competence protein ComEC/Rec2 [Nitrospira sp. KM1]BCA53664.1 putative Competence protein ComEC/Rec2 related protein [Nitrospira sp. KM1]